MKKHVIKKASGKTVKKLVQKVGKKIVRKNEWKCGPKKLSMKC